MYQKLTANMNFAQRELEVLDFWKENHIFEKTAELRKDCPPFSFYDGPPTANGMPHIGHVETRAIKDLIPRHRTMKGYNVLRKAGWDTHGLPVELEVEKKLGITGKPDIVKYGIEPFIKQCKESVWKYKSEWEEMSERVGYWVDMEDPYVTYTNDYIESEWWALKQIWDKGLIYKGHKVVPYCPRCGTPLSSHEVAQGYEEVTETSVFVKFKVKEKDQYILAWTTTPWTLPSNVALAVNAVNDYALVEREGEQYIRAKALLETALKAPYKVLDTFPGSSLVGVEYDNLFGFYESEKKSCYVVSADFVSLEDGTGVVHIAPAFGEDDAEVGRIYDLPFVQLIDAQGNFTPEAKPWAGIFAKDADPLIIRHMADNKTLYKSLKFTHSYPFCWRCHTPLLYYARETWFIKMTAVRDELVANNKTVTWLPENIGTNRFGKFIEDVRDWSLSRERFWGTPLPVWECSCGHKELIGSIEELKNRSVEPLGDIELHKPYIDEVKIKCPKCGQLMNRVPEVIDCWFDSGCMPFAQWHYPFENKETFAKYFPADFISEAIDQTRGWFYSLIAISTLVFGCSPYKAVIVMGHVLDKDGNKMSKHLGNTVDPKTVLSNQGADAARWHFYNSSAPWLPSRFYDDPVNDAQRKVMGTFWNACAFYVLYAEIDQFNPFASDVDFKSSSALTVMDRWILSRLNTLIETVDTNLDKYEITDSTRAFALFIEDLSNWYIRRGRERYWVSGMPEDKAVAYLVLHHVLVETAKLMAPFTPFLSESVYRALVATIDPKAPESVHLCDYPKADKSFIDPALETSMGQVLSIVVLGRAARNEAAIKNRQPLANMYAISNATPLDPDYVEIIKNELNVKQISFAADAEEFYSYSFKPQLRALGPKFGKLVPKIGQALQASDGNQLMKSLKQDGSIQLQVEGQQISLTEPDVLISSSWKEGFAAASDKGLTVVLDTTLTDALKEEGFVREIVSKIQTMRKEAGFEVTDRITVLYQASPVLTKVFQNNSAEISSDVLALSISGAEGDLPGYSKDWILNGESAKLSVQKG
ncbi:MAG: isoleucine--tRNA ligase [Clostridiales bacterium]|jgi:isoleucyl-tRNA synthetase|nr:isoleucine--tRNA ligase [Clostridiales bacterium]